MPLTDFLERSAVVVQGARLGKPGGRRFICHPPTVETVVRIEALFPAEIDATEQAFARRHEARPLDEDPVDHVLPVFVRPGDPRAARALRSCVELWGGAPGEVEEALREDHELALRCARACLGLCDVARIVSRMDRGPVDRAYPLPGREDPGGASELRPETAIVLIAREFSVSPTEIMRWPYDLLLTVAEEIEEVRREEAETAARLVGSASRATRPAVSPRPRSIANLTDMSKIPGVRVHDARRVR